VSVVHASPSGAPAPRIALEHVRASASGLIVGRDRERAAFVVPHPAVSRAHASLASRSDGSVVVTDLGSTNGTFVNGRRATGPTVLSFGGRLDIGPCSWTHAGDALVAASRSAGAVLEVDGLSLQRHSSGRATPLLQNVGLALPAGGVTCVLGPSGSGKSTLLSVISGRRRPSSGQVRVDDVDIHAHYDSIKQRIGFVPQREALHEGLTVAEMLRYTARLRLPADFTPAETDALIADLVQRTRLADRLTSRVTTLSGGERRRLGLVNELLGRPSLILLDEVTSGLDDESAQEIMQLVTQLGRDGMTVVCVTHTISAVEAYADQCIVLAKGGIAAFVGATPNVAGHFGVAAIDEIYREMRSKPPEHWRGRTPTGPTRAATPARPPAAVAPPPATATRLSPLTRARQAAILIQRYIDIVIHDTPSLVLAFGQAVIIGLLLRLLFGQEALSTARQLQLGFLFAVSAFWFGCNNAAKEIVKEQLVLRQEWAAGLRLSSYLLSKVVVLVALGLAQVLLLLLTFRLLQGQLASSAELLGIALRAVIAGTALGLLVSASARTTDAAATALPVLLIPQILLSEAIVAPLGTLSRWLARGGIASYWLQQDLLTVYAAKAYESVSGSVVTVTFAAGYTALALLMLRRGQRAL
jgi:ABC-type multidrug transport system ATPase subunit